MCTSIGHTYMLTYVLYTHTHATHRYEKEREKERKRKESRSRKCRFAWARCEQYKHRASERVLGECKTILFWGGYHIATQRQKHEHCSSSSSSTLSVCYSIRTQKWMEFQAFHVYFFLLISSMSLKTHQGMPRHKKDKIISICRPWEVSLPLILINLISIIANIPFRSLNILGVYKETYSLKMNENCATRVSQKPFLRSSFSWFRLRYNSRT